jgi:hypothetical protein
MVLYHGDKIVYIGHFFYWRKQLIIIFGLHFYKVYIIYQFLPKPGRAAFWTFFHKLILSPCAVLKYYQQVSKSVKVLRGILNFTPGPQGRTSPLGVSLVPTGETCPQGGMFTPLFTQGVNTLDCLEEWRNEHRNSPLGDNFTPRGQISPLGNNFTPGVKVSP